MNKENSFEYEGKIHKDFKKKVLLKLNLVILPIFSLITLSLISATLFSPDQTPPNHPPSGTASRTIQDLIGIPYMLFWLVLFVVIVPYIAILIISSVSLSMYTRNFTFKVTESNLVIHHGVFTRTKVTLPFLRIQSINITNGVFDRIFKLNTVKIETAGPSRAGVSATTLKIKPEGYIPGLKDPNIIEDKINEMVGKQSQIPSGLHDKIFKPEELAFDNFISYILSKMREGEKIKTKIKELREKSNISSAQLAEKVGVPIQTIQYLEEGRYNPSLTLAYKIAEVLNCKIEDLFQLA